MGIYLFKIKNKNTRTISKMCLRLTKKKPWTLLVFFPGVFIVDFEHVSAGSAERIWLKSFQKNRNLSHTFC